MSHINHCQNVYFLALSDFGPIQKFTQKYLIIQGTKEFYDSFQNTACISMDYEGEKMKKWLVAGA